MSANPSAIEAPLPESEIKDLLRAEFGNRAAFDELDFYQTDIYRRFDFEAPSKVLLVDDEREFVETLSELLIMRDMGSAVRSGHIDNPPFTPRRPLAPHSCASTWSSAPRTAATWARLHSSSVTFGLSG